MKSKSTVVGVHEARMHFAELLRRVVDGQEITITRRGTPVPKIVRTTRKHSPAERHAAIERILELSARNRLNGLSIRELINAGRA